MLVFISPERLTVATPHSNSTLINEWLRHSLGAYQLEQSSESLDGDSALPRPASMSVRLLQTGHIDASIASLILIVLPHMSHLYAFSATLVTSPHFQKSDRHKSANLLYL
jgi:hypothetical protein